MAPTKCIFSAGFALVILTASTAHAAPVATGGASLQVVVPPSPDKDGSPIADAVPLSATDLASYRGGATVVTASQTLTATTTGNVLNGNFTGGSVNLSGNALTNFSGIGNFAINTGAQVSLQSGLNLVVNVAP